MRALILSATCRRRTGLAAFASLLVACPAVAQDSAPPTSTTTEGADNRALWMGMRWGAFVPFGGLYAERSFVTTPFQDVATGGPAVELDVGARFARRFVGYGFFEHAWLGRGQSPAWTNAHDGQRAASTQAIGVGLRWISNPESLGFVADVGLSYRWFSARWADATTVRMQGFGDIRVGLGANWLVVRHWALVPMLTLYTGAFSERTLDGEPLGAAASSYVAGALSVGGYLDL
jgi:hypothetical protein